LPSPGSPIPVTRPTRGWWRPWSSVSKLLADSIDHLEARLAHTTRPLEVVPANVVPREMRDITAEIHDITAQVGKLAKMIKKAAKEK
jgi:hypothetical protein